MSLHRPFCPKYVHISELKIYYISLFGHMVMLMLEMYLYVVTAVNINAF